MSGCSVDFINMETDRQDNQIDEAKESLQKGLRILAKIIAREILAGRFPNCPGEAVEKCKGGDKND